MIQSKPFLVEWLAYNTHIGPCVCAFLAENMSYEVAFTEADLRRGAMNLFNVSAVVGNLPELLTQEIRVCSRSHLLSSELDPVSYNLLLCGAT